MGLAGDVSFVTDRSANRFGLGKVRRRYALAIARLMRLRDEERGATAVEFALVALPFLFMVMSMLELAAVFLVYTTLDNAMANAARTIRTHNSAPPSASAFITATCNNMGWLQSTCSSQLHVDIRTELTFANPVAPDPMATGVFNPAALTYDLPLPGQIVLVRAFYEWPLILPIMDAALSKYNNGVAQIIATTTFVVEPS